MNSRSTTMIHQFKDDGRERRTFRPYVLILTASSLHGEEITATDYERLKHIPVPKIVRSKLLADQIIWVSRTVIEHFVSGSGIIAPYGQITGYLFRRSPEDSVRFGIGGHPIDWFAAVPIEVLPRPAIRRRRAAARTAHSASRAAPPPFPDQRPTTISVRVKGSADDLSRS
jgi:hypothetical protein